MGSDESTMESPCSETILLLSSMAPPMDPRWILDASLEAWPLPDPPVRVSSRVRPPSLEQDSQKDMHIVHQLLCALYHVLRTPTINHPLQRPKWSRAPSHDPRSINCFRPACSIHSMSQATLGLSSKMRPLHVMGIARRFRLCQ